MNTTSIKQKCSVQNSGKMELFLLKLLPLAIFFTQTGCGYSKLPADNSIDETKTTVVTRAKSERILTVADSLVGLELKSGTPGITLAVAKDGEIFFSKAYGSSDLETNAPATPHTIYNISSITKQFTAVTILRLVEQGKLSLGDPIKKYLPGYPVDQDVKIHHLLNHTSGIKSFSPTAEENRENFKMDLSYEEMKNMFAQDSLLFSPGENIKYNNMGYYLLGHVIEKVTGSNYGDFVEDEMLRPFDINETFYCKYERIIPNRSEGYSSDGQNPIRAPYFSVEVGFSAGGLCSTVGDLVRWTSLLHKSGIISSASLQKMMSPTVLSRGDTINVGFGLGLDRLGDHLKASIAGKENGFSSVLSHYPDDQLTITVLTNSGFADPQKIEDALARVIFDMEVKNLPLTNEQIIRYSGTYNHTVGTRKIELTVFEENGRLKMATKGGKPFDLLYQGKNTFLRSKDYDEGFVFQTDDGLAKSFFLLHDNSRRWIRQE